MSVNCFFTLSRQFVSCATATTRQHVRALMTNKNSKHVIFLPWWSCHNGYSNNAITNNFEAGKHDHVVAAVWSRAQLKFFYARHYVLVPVGRIKLPDPSVRMGGYLGLLVPSVILQSSPAFLKVENWAFLEMKKMLVQSPVFLKCKTKVNTVP